jgi:hypothetical protein
MDENTGPTPHDDDDGCSVPAVPVANPTALSIATGRPGDCCGVACNDDVGVTNDDNALSTAAPAAPGSGDTVANGDSVLTPAGRRCTY